MAKIKYTNVNVKGRYQRNKSVANAIQVAEKSQHSYCLLQLMQARIGHAHGQIILANTPFHSKWIPGQSDS
jgi:hypothetical protein